LAKEIKIEFSALGQVGATRRTQQGENNTMKRKTKTTWAVIGSLILLTVLVVRAEVAPTAQVTFIVKDDFGRPIAGVDFGMVTFLYWKPGEGFGEDINIEYKGKTDKNGIVTIKGGSLRGRFAYGMDNNKNYYSRGVSEYCFKERKLGRWEPWNPTIEVVYKPVLNPIPYIGGGGRKKIPECEKAIGFDLFLNDWIAPYGKGKNRDIIFTLEEKIPFVEPWKPHDHRLKISFPNEGDGIQSCYAPVNSGEMEMPRYAPKDGYERNIELRSGCDGKKYFTQRSDQNYFIRVRTILDKDGKVQSALYGKITGNIEFWHTREMVISYGLNPNALDVNMEFDRKKNLLDESWQKKQE
jgi:hypothetical protein